jgi:hypothetical protein
MPLGVGGSPVRALAAGAFTAWVETVADRVIEPTLERVRAHDAVADAALATGATPLPARFGQVFESDERCRDVLLENSVRLEADLARVQGLVEMRVVAALRKRAEAEPPAEAETPGTAYMQRLRRKRGMEQIVQGSAAAVRRRLTETVGAFVRGEAVVLDPSPVATFTVSHLIDRDAVSAYRAALHGAVLGAEVERFVVCGPVAPYQFVSAPND